MVKAGATLGRYLRKIMTSSTWKTVQETSRRIRYLPNTLARQAGIDEFQKELDLKASIEKDMDATIAPPKRPRSEGRAAQEGTNPLGSWTQPPEETPDAELEGPLPGTQVESSSPTRPEDTSDLESQEATARPSEADSSPNGEQEPH
jgi:hypothetical protein